VRLRLSAPADLDLKHLYEHGLDQFGEAQADRYYDGLLDAFERIRQHPQAARKRIVEGHEFRVRRYQSHSIVYQLLDDAIVIVRVLHGAQDLKRHVRD
jgi:toxin ParE1/3/4